MVYFRSIYSAALFLVFVSCKVDPKISDTKLTEVLPNGWPKPVYTFSTNVLSESKFQLGRALFYEPMLSRNDSVSCASCHQNNVAFANADHAVSHGIRDREGERNSPALFNLAWHPYFMHDGGINHIEVQPLAPIKNPIEMDEDINRVLQKLQNSNKYRVMFKNAFGEGEITSQKFLFAMTQFMGTLYSYNSKYDRIQRDEKNVSFTTEEKRGYEVFKANCNTCHKEPLFSDFAFRNNGLAINRLYNDSGRAHISGLAEDVYKFKTPSLRNIEFTAPYMHDGRFNTLDECLNHYTNPMANTINLDPLLKNGLPINEQDKRDLIAFLKTLTDYSFMQDTRFADPKRNP